MNGRKGEFEGRIALVTGAAGGIGAALAARLAEEGARVIGADLPEALGTVPDTARAEPLDIADSTAVEALVDRIEDECGPIDLGVNVAGLLSTRTVIETTDAEWRRVFAVNSDGVFHFGRALGRRMAARRRGALVMIGSNAAGVPRHAMAAYAASKAAAAMLTRCLGLELAGAGVRCNIVAPGSTLTPMQTGMWADADGAAQVIRGSLETFRAGIPLGKLAMPADIAEAALFLLSDRAGHITMAELYVDGGATLRA